MGQYFANGCPPAWDQTAKLSPPKRFACKCLPRPCPANERGDSGGAGSRQEKEVQGQMREHAGVAYRSRLRCERPSHGDGSREQKSRHEEYKGQGFGIVHNSTQKARHRVMLHNHVANGCHDPARPGIRRAP